MTTMITMKLMARDRVYSIAGARHHYINGGIELSKNIHYQNHQYHQSQGNYRNENLEQTNRQECNK